MYLMYSWGYSQKLKDMALNSCWAVILHRNRMQRWVIRETGASFTYKKLLCLLAPCLVAISGIPDLPLITVCSSEGKRKSSGSEGERKWGASGRGGDWRGCIQDELYERRINTKKKYIDCSPVDLEQRWDPFCFSLGTGSQTAQAD